MTSGSYAPGDISLFKGLGNGAFAAREKLLDINGKPARAGLASSVALADWDRDGKLDLIVGNIRGEVSWLRNESKDGKLAFGAKQPLNAGDQPIQHYGDAGPLVADWDGDGIADLLVGFGDGAVIFYKASGTTGAPALAPGVTLIAPLEEMAHDDARVALDPKTGDLALPNVARSQQRTKLAVYDWNGDGKLDLLVGDFVGTTGPEPVLTAEQTKQRDDLEKQFEAASREVSNAIQAATDRAKKELGIENEWRNSDAQERVFNRETEILHEDSRYRELSKQEADIWKKLSELKPKHGTHGFVWVYLRK